MANLTGLHKGRLFSGLTSEEVDVVAGVCEERMLMSGEDLFLEGEAGDSIWIILSGRVEVYKNIRGDVDRTLASLGAGDVIGEMSFIDASSRSAGARTSESSEFLILTAEAFVSIQKEYPAIAAAFYRNIASVLADRVRNTNNLYRESVAFSIEATGAGKLNLLALSEELKPVTINLDGGRSMTGRILQMDNSPAGYTLVLKENGGRVAIIPYHAIKYLEVE